MNDSVILKAPAKINLSLDITGLRDDGYHMVRMLMQTIDLFDIVRVEKKERGVRLDMGDALLPKGPSNLAFRAAELVLKEAGIEGGVSIEIEKNIPLSAGLAGGSTDAAAVLKGVNELYGAGLTIDELCKLGLELGADVPFCVTGGSVLCEGIGEEMTDLPDLPHCSIVLVKPPQGVSTRQAYTAFDSLDNPHHPDVDGQIEALRAGDLSGVCSAASNCLELVTSPRFPAISACEKILESHGARLAMMSGSGPTVFGIFDDRSRAEEAADSLGNVYPEYFIHVGEPYFP
ncbi:MAG: 4-(cytidine 5'-diphospho)-2-C-methyl-D-erythritol kinase [Eubacterium sp.]|nr:4-(cytidine 5'-diphospho)-2-C-methyl-D-erythritol kinase [Eubacterium sp.]